jgi:hypothetical protein
MITVSNECHYAEFHYDECHDLAIVMLNFFMLSLVMLNVIMPNVMAPMHSSLFCFNISDEEKKTSGVSDTKHFSSSRMQRQNSLECLSAASTFMPVL